MVLLLELRGEAFRVVEVRVTGRDHVSYLSEGDFERFDELKRGCNSYS